MNKKIRAFITLSLLSISLSSFATLFCPDVDYLNSVADSEYLKNVPSISGTMTIRQAVPRVEHLKFEYWLETSIHFGYLYCSYKTNNLKGTNVVSESGAWKPDIKEGRPTPWWLFDGGPQQPLCRSESGGTRETCIFRRSF